MKSYNKPLPPVGQPVDLYSLSQRLRARYPQLARAAVWLGNESVDDEKGGASGTIWVVPGWAVSAATLADALVQTLPDRSIGAAWVSAAVFEAYRLAHETGCLAEVDESLRGVWWVSSHGGERNPWEEVCSVVGEWIRRLGQG